MLYTILLNEKKNVSHKFDRSGTHSPVTQKMSHNTRRALISIRLHPFLFVLKLIKFPPENVT